MSGVRDKYAGTHLGAGFCFPAYVPVSAEITLPDFELYTYFSTLHDHNYLFFLESLNGEENGRYSILGYYPLLIMEARGELVKVNDPPHTIAADVFSCLRAILQAQKPNFAVQADHFYGGMVGYWGYDLAFKNEGIGRVKCPPSSIPDAIFFLPAMVVIQDRYTSVIRVYGFYPETGEGEQAARDRVQETLRAIIDSARRSVSSRRRVLFRVQENGFTSNTTRAEFLNMVVEAQEHIRRGDIFQVVISQRWERKTRADPEEVYAELRCMNPSPYMFYLRFPGFTLLGSSPEMLVRVEGDLIQTRPIAGTRPVTGDRVRDTALRQELAEDAKEKAEHVMLVDLGRNDVGKVSRPGTVQVKEFMKLETYSHVVHLVSQVEGRLRQGEDSLSALQACFPAGTLTGAPKRRAMEIIDQLERSSRGPYGGAVGYVGLDGRLDSCITIRSILFRKGVCYLQAGAGIVADSVPESEYQETVSKAGALMRAVLNAERRYDTND